MSVLQNRLVECLSAKKQNQSWLAMRLGRSRAYVSRIASGKIQPSLESALKIARVFGKPVEEIFYVSEFPGANPPTSGKINQPAEINKITKGKSV